MPKDTSAKAILSMKRGRCAYQFFLLVSPLPLLKFLPLSWAGPLYLDVFSFSEDLSSSPWKSKAWNKLRRSFSVCWCCFGNVLWNIFEFLSRSCGEGRLAFTLDTKGGIRVTRGVYLPATHTDVLATSGC